jgi:hypothetical protein
MLTIFSTTKPFTGHIGVIQRNALASWARLSPEVQIILFGDETGTAEAAREIGALHVTDIERNERGTPLLNSVFGRAEQLSRHRFLCYANADIIFTDDLLPALERVSKWREKFLIVGECWNLDVPEALPVGSAGWGEALRARVRQEGRRRGRSALDFFVFPKGGYARWLPLALGRGGFDNWLVWGARTGGAAVVDVTDAVTVVHQNHSYGHVAGGFVEAHMGEEARRNCELAGGMKRMLTLDDATHRLEDGVVRPAWGHFLRLAHRRTRLRYRWKKWTGNK